MSNLNGIIELGTELRLPTDSTEKYRKMFHDMAAEAVGRKIVAYLPAKIGSIVFTESEDGDLTTINATVKIQKIGKF